MDRKRISQSDSEVELGRVITPFLDMAFQILFFFVMMYRPSALEGSIELALPSTATGVAEAKPTSSSTETDVDLPAELEVIVRTAGLGEAEKLDGSILKIVVKDSAGVEKAFDTLDQLKNHLKNVRKNLNNQNDIKLQGDGRLKYLHLVRAMDACRSVGFNNVSFSPPHDLERIIPGVRQ